MSARDAGFLYLERSHTQLHIGCVAIVEGGLAREQLVARIEERLPELRRYSQRVIRVPLSLGHPSWEEDPEFHADHHITRWGLPAPGGEGELREVIARLMEQPLDRARPLWEMHLIEGLAGGRSAVLQKVHHCMIDGMAGAQLLELLLENSPRVPEAVGALPVSTRMLPDPSRRVLRALGDAMTAQARMARQVCRTLSRPNAARDSVLRLRNAAYAAVHLASTDVPEFPWNAPLGPRRAVAFTKFSLDGVRRVRAARGGSVNDVVLAVLAGGLKRWLEAHGRRTRGLELTAMVPVSLRNAEDAAQLGNRIAAMLVPLAVDHADEVSRLAATRAITGRLKENGAWTGIDALLELVDGLPPPLVAWAAERLQIPGLASVVATNVPGPREVRWLCGEKVEELRPLVPIADGIGLGLAVFSYDGTLYVGLQADSDLVPDLEKLETSLEESFAALLGSADARPETGLPC